MLKCTIYIATHKNDRKAYIGYTKQSLKARITNHAWHAKANPSASLFNTALNKEGRTAFTFSVLHTCANIREAQAWERYFIRKLHTRHPNGYNQMDGGSRMPYRVHRQWLKRKLREHYILARHRRLNG